MAKMCPCAGIVDADIDINIGCIFLLSPSEFPPYPKRVSQY